MTQNSSLAGAREGAHFRVPWQPPGTAFFAPRRGRSEPLAFPRPGARLVRALVPGADPGAAARLAPDLRGQIDAAARSHGLRQDAGCLPGGAGPAALLSAAREAGPVPGPVYFPVESAGRGRGAQPARAADGHRQSGARARRRIRRADDRHPHRRHPRGRARALQPRACRYFDHHAGVAVSDADLERARDAARRAHRDRGRSARAGAEQARRASGHLAGAAAPPRGCAAAAHRTVGHAESAR